MPHPDEILGLAMNRRGSWTPADNSGAGLAITVNSAIWAVHDRLVIARARITYPVTASGAANELTGLPFAVLVPPANRQGFITYADVAVARYLLTPSGTTIRFYDSAGVQLTNAQLSAATVYFTCMYDCN